MLKIKIIAILFVFGVIGIVLSTSDQFSSKAQTEDIFDEIAEYKTWTKINEKPIQVELTLDFSGG